MKCKHKINNKTKTASETQNSHRSWNQTVNLKVGGSPHQVGHNQSWGSAPASGTVHQSPPCLVLVNPLSHRVKVLFQGGMRLILDGDVEDLQTVHLRVGHVVQSTGVNYEGDVPAGQHTAVQSRVQTAEVQTRTDLRNRHVYLQDKTEGSAR